MRESTITFYTRPKLQQTDSEERNKLLENRASDETPLQKSYLIFCANIFGRQNLSLYMNGF
jgi:hypothetical protein